MAKHRHILMVNSVGKNAVRHKYSFGSTKGIEVTLSESGFSIVTELTKRYDAKEMLSGNSYLFPDAIKKALLLYLLKFSKALRIKKMTVQIDEEKECIAFDDDVTPPIYSMINGDLLRRVPSAFSEDTVFEQLLGTPKTQYDRRIAALFALLCSKSKVYETERFIYLWTAFNGMYGWLSEFVAKANKIERYRKESKQIVGFLKFFEIGSETIGENDKAKIAHAVTPLLKEKDAEDLNRGYFEKGDVSKRIAENLKKSSGENYNLTAYGYLLAQLSYYFRCKIIHGSKPVFFVLVCGR